MVYHHHTHPYTMGSRSIQTGLETTIHFLIRRILQVSTLPWSRVQLKHTICTRSKDCWKFHPSLGDAHHTFVSSYDSYIFMHIIFATLFMARIFIVRYLFCRAVCNDLTWLHRGPIFCELGSFPSTMARAMAKRCRGTGQWYRNVSTCANTIAAICCFNARSRLVSSVGVRI